MSLPHPGTCALPPSSFRISNFTGHARDFTGQKAFQFVHVGIDGVFSSRVSPFTSSVISRDKSPGLLQLSPRRCCALGRKISGHSVDPVGQIFHVPCNAVDDACPPSRLRSLRARRAVTFRCGWIATGPPWC